MSVDQFVNIFVTVTLVEMMAALGLGVTLAELFEVAKRGHLIVRTALANYVLVPGATVALLLWFQTPPMIAAGFLILAACPGAPFGPPLTALSKGDVKVSVGL